MAEHAFDRLFREKQVPEEIPTAPLPTDAEVWLPKALADAGLVASNSEARRLIKQGAVKVNGERIDAETLSRDALENATVQVGKRRFVRFVTI